LPKLSSEKNYVFRSVNFLLAGLMNYKQYSMEWFNWFCITQEEGV